jgi:hypothetical protein
MRDVGQRGRLILIDRFVGVYGLVAGCTGVYTISMQNRAASCTGAPGLEDRAAMSRPLDVTVMRRAMRSIGVAALCALLACAATFTVSGCGATKPAKAQIIERYSQKLREAVSTNVPDEGRRAKLILVVDQVEALHGRFSQETAEFVASFRKRNADFDSTRQAFDQLFADYNAKRLKAREDALELHFQLASLATADEWDAIGKAETKLYEEANAASPAEEGSQ